MNLMGRLYAHGQPISWTQVNAHGDHGARSLHDLPPYPWQRGKVLWSEPRASLELRTRKFPHHELLGSVVPGGDGRNLRWRNRLRLEDVRWLQDHKLESTVIFPAAGYLGMALEAVTQAVYGSVIQRSDLAIVMRNVKINAAMMLNDGVDVELFTTLRPTSLDATSIEKASWNFEIVSYQDDSSTLHCIGSVTVGKRDAHLGPGPDASITGMKSLPAHACYRRLAQVGLNFGPEFQSIKTIHTSEGMSPCAISETVHPVALEVSAQSYRTPHPIVIDALLQTGIIAQASGSVARLEGMVPVFLEHAAFAFMAADEAADVTKVVAKSFELPATRNICLDASLQNRSGRTYVRIGKARMTSYAPGMAEDAVIERTPMTRVVWKPVVFLNDWKSDDIKKQLDCIEANESLIARLPIRLEK